MTGPNTDGVRGGRDIGVGVDDHLTLVLDDEVLAVIVKEAKKRREAADAYVGAGRTELAEKENAELACLEGYLPKQLSDDEIDAIVAEAVSATGASGMKDMGKVMGILKPKLAGRADMTAVSAQVKKALAGA